MAVNGKRKGKTGELELAKKLNEYGFNTRRSVQYNGKADDGKADLVNLPGIHIECKRVERLNVSEAMTQAINDANGGDLPTVFHRKNREPWLVTMRLDDWMELYNQYNATLKKEGNRG